MDAAEEAAYWRRASDYSAFAMAKEIELHLGLEHDYETRALHYCAIASCLPVRSIIIEDGSQMQVTKADLERLFRRYPQVTTEQFWIAALEEKRTRIARGIARLWRVVAMYMVKNEKNV